MNRDEAITTLKEMHDSFDEIHENTNGEIGYEQMTAIDMAIEALAKPRVVFLCDGRKCGNECSEMCFMTTDVSHAKNFVRLGDEYFEKEEENDE